MNGWEYSILTSCTEHLNRCILVLRESVDVEIDGELDDEELVILGKPSVYLLPQSLNKVIYLMDVLLPFVTNLGNIAIDDTQRLAYEYLAFTLENHKNTTLYLLETILEELPPVDGLKGATQQTTPQNDMTA